VNEMVHAGIATLTAVFVVTVLTARWWNTPVRDTAPYADGHDTVVTPIADLMGDWEWDWEPVYGVALELARGDRA
jgi:hypothetical protein